MKICFTQSISEIEHIKKILGFIPVVVPLSLDTLIYCDVNKIQYLNPENYINKDFYKEAKNAYCIVTTTDARPFGCFILTKGVILPDGKVWS